MILDSVLPPDVHFDESASENLRRALDLVFAGCAVDPDCAAAYPDAARRLGELIRVADERPLKLDLPDAATGGDKVEVRGAEIVAALYAALHEPESIARIPAIVNEAAAGRVEQLKRFIGTRSL